MPLREDTDEHLKPPWQHYLKIFFCDYPHCQLGLHRSYASQDGIYRWQTELQPLPQRLNEWRRNSHHQLRGSELERMLDDLGTWYRRHVEIMDITFFPDGTFKVPLYSDSGRWWPDFVVPKKFKP